MDKLTRNMEKNIKRKIRGGVTPQSVLINRVVVLEPDSFVIIGSGYAITKSDGMQRLDIMDMKGNCML